MFLSRQIADLKKLTFSDELQAGLFEHDLDAEYATDEVFTVLIASLSGDEKTVIDGFCIVRIDTYAHRAELISLHPDISIPLVSVPGQAISTYDMSYARVTDLAIIGELQQSPQPLAFALYQLEELFALHIDGYVVFPSSLHTSFGGFAGTDEPWAGLDDQQGYKAWTEYWNTYWDEYIRAISILRVWSQKDLVSHVDSNLTVVDLYTFAKDYAGIPEQGISSRVLENSDLIIRNDERGEKVWKVDTGSIDELISNTGQDDRIDREQARIEILNGTNISGLGTRYDRLVRHLGGQVIRVKNAPERFPETTIYLPDAQAYPYTLSRIESLWSDVRIIEGRPNFATTGDIIIVLGMDFPTR